MTAHSASRDDMREVMDTADCLISHDEVERALDRMAEEITRSEEHTSELQSR